MPLEMVIWMTNRLCEYLANHEEFVSSHISFLEDALRSPEEQGLDEYQGPRISRISDHGLTEELRG